MMSAGPRDSGAAILQVTVDTCQCHCGIAPKTGPLSLTAHILKSSKSHGVGAYFPVQYDIAGLAACRSVVVHIKEITLHRASLPPGRVSQSSGGYTRPTDIPCNMYM